MEAFPKSHQSLVEATGVPIEVVADEVPAGIGPEGVISRARCCRSWNGADSTGGSMRTGTAMAGHSVRRRKTGGAAAADGPGHSAISGLGSAGPRAPARYIQDAGPVLLLLGNPAIWLWAAMTANFDGDELKVGAILWTRSSRFRPSKARAGIRSAASCSRWEPARAMVRVSKSMARSTIPAMAAMVMANDNA